MDIGRSLHSCYTNKLALAFGTLGLTLYLESWMTNFGPSIGFEAVEVGICWRDVASFPIFG